MEELWKELKTEIKDEKFSLDDMIICFNSARETTSNGRYLHLTASQYLLKAYGSSKLILKYYSTKD